jgi:hypothetical protein
MIPRASLLAICFLWMAYESHFSPTFFVNTVQASLADIQAGLDEMLARDMDSRPGWHTASVDLPAER